jgi:hypothetical protein
MNPFAAHPSTFKPFARNGYTFHDIADAVPGGWISKTRLNGIAISTDREASASGSIIVFPADASVGADFWDRLAEWSREGVGPGHHRVTVGRFLKGRFETKRERFDQNSLCLEIDSVGEEELAEVATMIGRELGQAVLLVKSAATGRIWVVSSSRADPRRH